LKRLIVTADDFGVAREVNDAVEAAHRGGVLTAASLMVAAPAAADAIARARRLPSLRVGLHVVLVEGRPLLPASAVTHLVDDAGLRRFVNVYLNDEDVRFLAGLDTPVKDGDTVTVLPAVAGGGI